LPHLPNYKPNSTNTIGKTIDVPGTHRGGQAAKKYWSTYRRQAAGKGKTPLLCAFPALQPVPQNCGAPTLSAVADFFFFFFAQRRKDLPAEGRRKEILFPSEAVDGKIYFFSPKGAEPAYRRLCGLSAAAED